MGVALSGIFSGFQVGGAIIPILNFRRQTFLHGFFGLLNEGFAMGSHFRKMHRDKLGDGMSNGAFFHALAQPGLLRRIAQNSRLFGFGNRPVVEIGRIARV